MTHPGSALATVRRRDGGWPRPACRRPSRSRHRGSAPRTCRRSRSSGRPAAARSGSRPPRAAPAAGRGAAARAACGTSRGRRRRPARPARAGASPARRRGTARARTSAAATRPARLLVALAVEEVAPVDAHHRGARAGRDDDRRRRRTSARSVRRATLRASGTNPLFHAGWPQQVAPEGRSEATPAAARSRSESRTAAGFSASPRQVGKRATTARHHTAMTVHVTSVALSYGADEVLADVSAILRPRDRVALVGRNGAGKTTLLRMLAGELAAGPGRDLDAAGHASGAPRPAPAPRRLRHAGLVRRRRGREGARSSRRELRDLEARMAEHPTDAVLRRYDAAQREFERAGGYAWRTRLEAVARGLGFSPADLDRPLRTFSGGELTRASLVRALAAEPDVLLLDEPTNHLDTDAIEWLEEPPRRAGRRGRVRVARPLVPRVGRDRRARDRPRPRPLREGLATPTGAG